MVELMEGGGDNDVESTISRGGVVKKYKLTRSVEDDGNIWVKDSSKHMIIYVISMKGNFKIIQKRQRCLANREIKNKIIVGYTRQYRRVVE